MKNFKQGLLLIGMILLLSGCGEKKLTCTKDDSNTGESSSYKMVLTYKKDTLTKMHATDAITLSDEYKDQIDDMVSKYNSLYDDFNKIDGFKATVTGKDNVITITVDTDVTKLSDDDKSSLGVNVYSTSYNDAKSNIEADGFTCK